MDMIRLGDLMSPLVVSGESNRVQRDNQPSPDERKYGPVPSSRDHFRGDLAAHEGVGPLHPAPRPMREPHTAQLAEEKINNLLLRAHSEIIINVNR